MGLDKSECQANIGTGAADSQQCDIAIYRQLSVKTMNAEPSGRAPDFVFRQKNDAA